MYSSCEKTAENNIRQGVFHSKIWGLKYMIFLKGVKLDFICMKMKLMKNKKYLQRKCSQNLLVTQTTADFTSRVSKRYVPFTCKFPMVMHFVPILHRRRRSKTNFYVFIYDITSLKFCESFKFFLAVFMEKFPQIHYLDYVRRGRVLSHVGLANVLMFIPVFRKRAIWDSVVYCI